MSRSQEEIESYNREFLENREGDFQDRLCIALERIADALEKAALPTLHEAVESAAEEECSEFEPSGLAVAADPDGTSDCQGTGWYRCKECARKG
jgi:hypothetical protein